MEHTEYGQDPKKITNCRPIAPTDAEKYLSGNIKYLAVSGSHSFCINYQSCDCQEVVIGTDQGLLLAKHDTIDSHDEEYDEEYTGDSIVSWLQEDNKNSTSEN